VRYYWLCWQSHLVLSSSSAGSANHAGFVPASVLLALMKSKPTLQELKEVIDTNDKVHCQQQHSRNATHVIINALYLTTWKQHQLVQRPAISICRAQTGHLLLQCIAWHPMCIEQACYMYQTIHSSCNCLVLSTHCSLFHPTAIPANQESLATFGLAAGRVLSDVAQKRFVLDESAGSPRIRAAQGHSLQLEAPVLQPVTDASSVECAVHATSKEG
jgi:hypothetical protein